MPTIAKEFFCFQERANIHDRHAVADGDRLGMLASSFGQIEEVGQFLLWRCRFVALVTADAGNIRDDILFLQPH